MFFLFTSPLSASCFQARCCKRRLNLVLGCFRFILSCLFVFDDLYLIDLMIVLFSFVLA